MAKWKEGDLVTVTIGRKDQPVRETHPAVVTYVTPADKLGVTVVETTHPDGSVTVDQTPKPQTYHVQLTDVPEPRKKGEPKAVVSYSVEEGDLAAA